MEKTRRDSAKRVRAALREPVIQGLVAGVAATQALDRLSILLYEKERESTRIREDEARQGLHAYEVAVDRMSRRFGVALQKKDLQVWGWRFHKAFGIAGGLLYAMLRRTNPRVGAGWGLGFGTAFFLIGDELLVPLLKLTPGPRAFSWKVHARGAVSHIAYGVAAESTIRAMEAA